ASRSPARNMLPCPMARVRTAPRIGPAQNPAIPPTAPSTKVRARPEPRVERCWSRSNPGSSLPRSKPTPRACSAPSSTSTTEVSPISRVRCPTTSVPSAPAPMPSGTSVTARPRQNTSACGSSAAREVTVEAKNPGSRSAPHGLSSASAPPRKAVSSPTSISALALGQRLVHHLGEHLGGLRADGRCAPDDEGGGGHGAEIDALLRVLRDRGLDLLGVHVGLELLGVQTELLGERDQGLLVEFAGGADLTVLEEPCVVLGVLPLHRRREARAC